MPGQLLEVCLAATLVVACGGLEHARLHCREAGAPITTCGGPSLPPSVGLSTAGDRPAHQHHAAWHPNGLFGAVGAQSFLGVIKGLSAAALPCFYGAVTVYRPYSGCC